MAFDLDRLRADTPLAPGLVHLDHAGASPSPRAVLDAVIGHLHLEAEVGGYAAAVRMAERSEAVYDALAELLGAQRDELALVDSSTRAWDLAISSVPLGRGDVVLTADDEYVSNVLAQLRLRDRLGIRVETVPSDADGLVDLDALSDRLAVGDVSLVCLTHVPSHNGLVQPAAEVGARCRGTGALFLLDACQSVGQLPVDVGDLGCDLLSGTGRKFLRGPRGTGFLYVRAGVLDGLQPPLADVRSAEWTGPDDYRFVDGARRFEIWERSPALLLGLGAAAELAGALGPAAIAGRVQATAATLRDRLADLPGVVVRDRGRRRSGIVTFTVDGRSATEVAEALADAGVTVSVSPASSAMRDLGARGLDGVVRASVHYLTDGEDLDRCVAVVAGLTPR